MSRQFRKFAICLVLISPTVLCAQSTGPLLIDEFSKLNSETAVVRLQSAMIQLGDRLVDHRDSLLEFVIYRGQNQPIGEAYRTFATQKAFYAAEHYDISRIASTICEPRPKPYVQIWLIDSVNQKHSCDAEVLKLRSTALFLTLNAPNEKYEMGSCCMIDEVDYAASMETLRSFADLINTQTGMTAYIVVYGGTNIFRYQDSSAGPEKVERHLDPPSFIAKLGKDVRQQLLAGGLDRSRFISVNGGYRDRYASIDLWIVPPGGKRPRPRPDYFLNRRQRLPRNER